MDFHHHVHQYCHHERIPPNSIPTSCYCSSSTPSQYHLHTVEPLLHPIASHICSPRSQPPSMYLNPSHNYFHHPQTHHHRQQSFRHHCEQEQEQEHELELTHPIISSLLRRVAVLESSLGNQSSVSRSLRDVAARTIQTHFRTFLVRRSRTLRKLKELAFIKLAVNTLKSDKTHLDPQPLLHNATDLLLKLDSIEGGDPMIRDGKRSISRELNRFIEFVDGFAVKKPTLPSRAVRNVRLDAQINGARVFYSDLKRDTANWAVSAMGKRGGRFEKNKIVSRTHADSDLEDAESESPILGLAQKRNGGLAKDHGRVQAKVKKCVTFAENGNVYRIIAPPRVQDTSGDCGNVDGSSDSVDEERDILENICKVEDAGVSSKETEDGEKSQTEDKDERPPKASNGERVSRMDQQTGRNFQVLRRDHGEDEGFLFSAPLPFKMESRGDLINKRKAPQVVE